ncbi:MAG: TRAP transporter small permease subunit [Pseudomonadales bacterium]|jgi:TRAP-type mannitol/chloroaromatic compound transport system permease small subunit|nr:TRAP transporter small permease subunit [Pseudomonadales bacterium]
MDAPHVDETLPHAPSGLPETRFSRAVDGLLLRLGALASWLWLVLLALVVLSVVLRYVFGEGRIELEELQWHVYAVGFLVALSLGIATDDHVRVDVLHERMPLRWRAWVEIYGTLLLLLPFVTLVLVHSIPFVSASFAVGEVSQAPGGLPLRWLIKGALPAGFLLLALAALARLSRATAFLFGTPRPLPRRSGDP